MYKVIDCSDISLIGKFCEEIRHNTLVFEDGSEFEIEIEPERLYGREEIPRLRYNGFYVLSKIDKQTKEWKNRN